MSLVLSSNEIEKLLNGLDATIDNLHKFNRKDCLRGDFSNSYDLDIKDIKDLKTKIIKQVSKLDLINH